uniref:Cytochrome c oxidase subunit 5B, mitochondrial n=1 Tax=Cuerna arida TaxID=1464854 RepID=A0A1B6F9C3_9HEMI
MALICARTVVQNSFRKLYTSSTSLAKVLDEPINIATGIEKREMLAKAAGNENPFDLRVLKRGKGTKDCPNEIPSATDARIVGCICEEDATAVSWMWLHQGQPRRCNCGYWFKLVYKPPV